MSTAREDWLSKTTAELSERDRRLLDRASAVLEANILLEHEGRPTPWAPLRGVCPSPHHYLGVWNWDSAFHAMTVARWDIELAREQVTIFLERQQPSGMLPDVIFANGQVVSDFGKPPVFPWACLRIEEVARSADRDFLRRCYDHFRDYEAFWRRDRGGKAEGLFHYDSAAADPEKRKNDARLESGWDNSVRWDAGSVELWPIDLNCYMFLLYESMEGMARILSTGESELWWERRDSLRRQINHSMWDDGTSAYCDIVRESRKPTGILSPASFMPVFCRIASVEQAARMAEVAADENGFFPGMPTVSYDHPSYSSSDYWRGPTWLNVAWFAVKGLRNYGFDRTADTIKDTILGWCDANSDAIYEYYDSRTGKGLGAPQYGWSAAFVIEFILDG